MTPQAVYLIMRGMAPVASQSAIIGPKVRCLMIQRRSMGDPLLKQNAASRTNGVVGKTGRKIPTMPTPNANSPARVQIGRKLAWDEYMSWGNGFSRVSG